MQFELGHARNLICFLQEPLFGYPGCVLRVIVMLEDQASTHLQCFNWGQEVLPQNLTIHDPGHPLLNAVQLPCPMCRKTPPKHDPNTPMLHSRDGVLGMVLIILLPPNTVCGIMTKKFYFFCLIWPHYFFPWHLWIIQMVISKLETGL